MIISASRRTDIPAFFSEWFLRRLQAGFVLTRNPMNHRQVSRIALNPDVVDCIVFWTKNPAPMLGQLERLRDYPFYFLYTVNPYGRDIETNLPDLTQRLDTFKRLADKIGPERVVWRYSPVLFNHKYTLDFHLRKCGEIVNNLQGYTEKCVMGFMDFYLKVKAGARALGLYEIAFMEKQRVAEALSGVILNAGIKVDMDICKDGAQILPPGVKPASCIDAALIERIVGYNLQVKKDPGQPDTCNCAASVEIGAYSTCANGCRYCYANSGALVEPKRLDRYDVDAPMLCGKLEEGDKVTGRAVKSLRVGGPAQIALILG